MIRAQIQITEAQERRLRRAARQAGVSFAEIVRRCIERGLPEQIPERSALYESTSRFIGSLRDPDGATDGSADHDRYLDKAYE